MNTASAKLDQSIAPTSGQPGASTSRITRVLILIIIGLAGASILSAKFNPAGMDYVSYWSAARLLDHHDGPYSPSGVFTLERSAGHLTNRPLMMRNPPWALFLVAPLGVLGIRAGLVLWMFALGACILMAVHLLNQHSRDTILALFFAPAIACFGSGQTSPILLLGFALFLFLRQRRPTLAGAALLLMAIKPHLFLVFWAVLLAEAIHRRKFHILAGLSTALAAATTFAMAMDPHIWQQYISMMRSSTLELETFPTGSMMFRILIDRNADWLLFVPSAIAILWGLWYYSHNRHQWNWNTHGMLLMLVTILATSYGWFTDEVVLLPSIIYALNLPERRKYAGWGLLVLNSIAILIIVVGGASTRFFLESPFLIWTPLAWLAWFLYTTRSPQPRRQDLIPSLGSGSTLKRS